MSATLADPYGWALSCCAADGRQWQLTPEGLACRGCGWADQLYRINRDRFPDGPGVLCEGVCWRDACRAHGFWGAINRVHYAAGRRLRR